MCAGRETKKNLKIWDDVSNVATRHTSQNRKHRKCFPTKPSCKIRGELEECRKKKGRHTISRMPGIRHRKSLYCRHRQQLWGDKKGNWHYWGSWDLSLLVSLCVWTQRGEKEKEKKKKKEGENRLAELACRFISVCLPTDLCEKEGHLWMNRVETEC